MINLGEETFSITRINKINQSSQLQGQPDDLFWYKTWHWNVSVILEDLFVELEFVLTFENPNFPVFETCFWNLRPPNWFEPPFCLVIQLKTRKQRKLRPKQSGYGFQKKWHSFRHFPEMSTIKFLDKMAVSPTIQGLHQMSSWTSFQPTSHQNAKSTSFTRRFLLMPELKLIQVWALHLTQQKITLQRNHGAPFVCLNKRLPNHKWKNLKWFEV